MGEHEVDKAAPIDFQTVPGGRHRPQESSFLSWPKASLSLRGTHILLQAPSPTSTGPTQQIPLTTDT